MNKILAHLFGELNAIFAWLFILLGGVAGYGLQYYRHIDPNDIALYVIIGSIIGLIVATFVCGFLALFIDIRNELHKLRLLGEKNGKI